MVFSTRGFTTVSCVQHELGVASAFSGPPSSVSCGASHPPNNVRSSWVAISDWLSLFLSPPPLRRPSGCPSTCPTSLSNHSLCRLSHRLLSVFRGFFSSVFLFFCVSFSWRKWRGPRGWTPTSRAESLPRKPCRRGTGGSAREPWRAGRTEP